VRFEIATNYLLSTAGRVGKSGIFWQHAAEESFGK